jgi:hypothetical protein
MAPLDGLPDRCNDKDVKQRRRPNSGEKNRKEKSGCDCANLAGRSGKASTFAAPWVHLDCSNDLLLPRVSLLPLFQSGADINTYTQGSAPLHPGLSSRAPLARKTPKPPFEKLFNRPAKALEYKTNLSN